MTAQEMWFDYLITLSENERDDVLSEFYELRANRECSDDISEYLLLIRTGKSLPMPNVEALK